MNFYQQGNHVCGSVYVNVGTFNDKTTIKFSTNDFMGTPNESLGKIAKLSGNVFNLANNVQHIIGTGQYRFDYSSASYSYATSVIALFDGSDTWIYAVINPNRSQHSFALIIDAIIEI